MSVERPSIQIPFHPEDNLADKGIEVIQSALQLLIYSSPVNGYILMDQNVSKSSKPFESFPEILGYNPLFQEKVEHALIVLGDHLEVSREDMIPDVQGSLGGQLKPSLS